MMAGFDAYGHAVMALALWAIMVTVLAMLSTIGRSDAGQCACGKPKRDYADPVYRRERAFANAVENSGPFIAVTVAAMLAGVGPFWVNLLASVFVVARIAMAAVHIGTVIQPLRSLCYVVGLVCVLALAIMTILAVL